MTHPICGENANQRESCFALRKSFIAKSVQLSGPVQYLAWLCPSARTTLHHANGMEAGFTPGHQEQWCRFRSEDTQGAQQGLFRCAATECRRDPQAISSLNDQLVGIGYENLTADGNHDSFRHMVTVALSVAFSLDTIGLTPIRRISSSFALAARRHTAIPEAICRSRVLRAFRNQGGVSNSQRGRNPSLLTYRTLFHRWLAHKALVIVPHETLMRDLALG
jgi:hypothetical protein